jgi:hypothetical protein
MLLIGYMQLVPNQLPAERLIVSMDAPESTAAPDASDSPFVLRGANVMSGNSRWLFIGLIIGALLLSIGGIVFSHYRDKNGETLRFPLFIKARTHSVAADPAAAAPPITVQLTADMVKVSAIALGHPRLAVINGRTVTEGDNITLHTPNTSVALILRVSKIGDGAIEFSDGKQNFSARLTIPSPPKPKAL